MQGQMHYLFFPSLPGFGHQKKIVSQGKDRVSNKMAKQWEERNITDNEANKNS